MIVIKAILFLFQILITIILSVYYSLLVIITPKNKEYLHSKYIESWAKKILKLFFVKLEITGKENISDNQNYIFISNHQSLFDIPVMFAVFPKNNRIIYKKELEKIPIFGYGLKKSLFFSIDREDPRNAMKSLNAAIETMKKNYSVIIFPEGTRSEDGSIGKLKRGAFFLAIRSGKPLVPVVLQGTKENLNVKQRRLINHPIKVKIFEPIRIKEEISRIEENAIINQIRDIIVDNYKK